MLQQYFNNKGHFSKYFPCCCGWLPHFWIVMQDFFPNLTKKLIYINENISGIDIFAQKNILHSIDTECSFSLILWLWQVAFYEAHLAGQHLGSDQINFLY